MRFLRPSLEHGPVHGRVTLEDAHLPFVLHRHRAKLYFHADLVGVLRKLVQHLRPWDAAGDPVEIHQGFPHRVDRRDDGECAVKLHYCVLWLSTVLVRSARIAAATSARAA